MKRILSIISLLCVGFVYAGPDDLNLVLSELARELGNVRKCYDERQVEYNHFERLCRKRLVHARNADEKLQWLVSLDSVRTIRENLKIEETADISRIRYLKGVQILRVLYDKILGLDHHFASVRTFNEINKISNPNNYPEFAKLKDILAQARKKESSLQIGSILGTNSVASIVMALGNIINSGLSRREQQLELEKVECIIDFTLRMHNDLNTIYFETAFLQKSSDKVREDLETLFRDYTKPIGYQSPLSVCRSSDDWEAVKVKTDQYMMLVKNADPVAKARMSVNIDFPVERLLQFITQYNAFIDQGGKFYEKFRIILNSYENEKPCQSKLPPEFGKLKQDIDLAIDKFNTAYKPVELNGSKMKEILYGINEFD